MTSVNSPVIVSVKVEDHTTSCYIIACGSLRLQIRRLTNKRTTLKESAPKSAEQRTSKQYTTSDNGPPSRTILLQGMSLTTYGMSDNGARATVINADIAKQLNLRGQRETVTVSTLLEKNDEKVEVAEFLLQSVTGDGIKVVVKEILVSTIFNVNRTLSENFDKFVHTHLASLRRCPLCLSYC